jgi:hypothetical protein
MHPPPSRTTAGWHSVYSRWDVLSGGQEGVAHARDIINAALEAHEALGDPLLVSHGLSRPGHTPGDLSEGASPVRTQPHGARVVALVASELAT